MTLREELASVEKKLVRDLTEKIDRDLAAEERSEAVTDYREAEKNFNSADNSVLGTSIRRR